MKIDSVKNISYMGRIKSGSIKKKLVNPSKGWDKSITTLDAKSEATINTAVDKIFEDPDNLKAIDYLKIAAIDSGATASTTSTIGGTSTTHSNTWSIYSSIFPSSF